MRRYQKRFGYGPPSKGDYGWLWLFSEDELHPSTRAKLAAVEGSYHLEPIQEDGKTQYLVPESSFQTMEFTDDGIKL